MTKRALVVIAIIILIPIIAVVYGVSKFKERNIVVAEYGGNIDIIEYDGMTLHKVHGEEEYNFRFGKFLGKVGDRLTGASLYLVAEDETGKYYAIADGTKRILYTESGELADGVHTENSRITRLVFDDYLVEEKDPENISKLIGATRKKVSVDMSEYPIFKYYDIYLSFDGSAVLTEFAGRLIYLTELEKWLFLSPDAISAAEEKYGEKIEDSLYVAELVYDKDALSLLESYFAD